MNTMNFQGYTARVEYDERDNIFVGRVLGLRNIISFHGKNVVELRREFVAAVKDYLADCEEQGIAPEKPASGKLLLRVPPEVHSRALVKAQELESMGNGSAGAGGTGQCLTGRRIRPPSTSAGKRRSMLHQMTRRASPDAVPANPSNWSESSQRSVSAQWTTEYTYEIKKAPIDKKRIPCGSCWERSKAITVECGDCERARAATKPKLRSNETFLKRWAQLLQERKEYVPYRADVARRNMLAKLLGDA